MKIIVAIVISLIVGNYALSPPLADVGMVPDYALDGHDFEESELEIDGDYINLDIESNQGGGEEEDKDLKENDLSFNIMADSKSRSVDIIVESGTFTYLAEDGKVATIDKMYHYNLHAIPDESATAAIEEQGFFTFSHIKHLGNGRHYTLPVETDPAI